MPKAIVMLEFTHDEVNKGIPYAMICETRFGRSWDTGKRKRLWLNSFSESEREKCSKLFSQARTWHLVSGVPDTVQMSVKTYELWQKLGAFCASL